MPTKPGRYLIDGYNLMHALGVQPHRLAEAGLQAARERLLDYLADHLQQRAHDVTVIFDAKRAPSRLASETEHRGIHVRFARGLEADDLIEDMLVRAAQPAGLCIVSNDLRLVRAAERRGSQAMRCADFLDELHAVRMASTKEEASSQEPGSPSTDDSARWLAEFAHLDKDPSLNQPHPLRSEDFED